MGYFGIYVMKQIMYFLFHKIKRPGSTHSNSCRQCRTKEPELLIIAWEHTLILKNMASYMKLWITVNTFVDPEIGLTPKG